MNIIKSFTAFNESTSNDEILEIDYQEFEESIINRSRFKPSDLDDLVEMINKFARTLSIIKNRNLLTKTQNNLIEVHFSNMIYLRIVYTGDYMLYTEFFKSRIPGQEGIKKYHTIDIGFGIEPLWDYLLMIENYIQPINYTNTSESFNNIDNDKIYYHCSNNTFDEFDLNNNKGYVEYNLPMWFFTEDINYAKTYGDILYTVKLNIIKTFDLSTEEHYNLFIGYLTNIGYDSNKIEEYLDETTVRDMVYWTCEEAFYCAIENGFDSILIQEELETEVISIAVFDVDNIEILSSQQI